MEEQLFKNILKKYNITVNEIDSFSDDGLVVAMGFYAHKLVDDLLKGNNFSDLQKHVSLINELSALNNDKITNALEIELFTSIYEDVGENNYIADSLNKNAKKSYEDAIKYWKKLNNL